MKTYLIFDGIYYKIGRSINIEKRFKTIKSNNPNAKIVAYSNMDIEYTLHNKYKEYCYHNEWFLIDDLFVVKNLLNEYEIIIIDNNESLIKLSTKQKQSIGAKKGNNKRRIVTIQKITDAKKVLEFMDKKPTQKNVLDLTGLSIATIKRNWNKKIIN